LLKPLHTWHHLSWLLFGYYPREVLDPVVFSSQALAHQKWILDENLIVFFVLEILSIPLI
jgi:hypothetical protein